MLRFSKFSISILIPILSPMIKSDLENLLVTTDILCIVLTTSNTWEQYKFYYDDAVVEAYGVVCMIQILHFW